MKIKITFLKDAAVTNIYLDPLDHMNLDEKNQMGKAKFIFFFSEDNKDFSQQMLRCLP